ncbi:hypothetical protein CC80DRAFT_185532 [Byssothecium circinans]|uniref:Uncharacterized protein n=1 Tax=Byssothecium circinans TaxID=147558 RepID=A0A6A5TK38_9PLEO|nr:hypothetical protein CC80DRAFT_185532 [Byssothecium circinans]
MGQRSIYMYILPSPLSHHSLAHSLKHRSTTPYLTAPLVNNSSHDDNNINPSSCMHAPDLSLPPPQTDSFYQDLPRHPSPQSFPQTRPRGRMADVEFGRRCRCGRWACACFHGGCVFWSMQGKAIGPSQAATETEEAPRCLCRNSGRVPHTQGKAAHEGTRHDIGFTLPFTSSLTTLFGRNLYLRVSTWSWS